jgi:hypothetical protein
VRLLTVRKRIFGGFAALKYNETQAVIVVFRCGLQPQSQNLP